MKHIFLEKPGRERQPATWHYLRGLILMAARRQNPAANH
jgi:hypothetical protein